MLRQVGGIVGDVKGIAQTGVRAVRTRLELAAASDVVILCVTGTPEVEAVLLGSGGVLEHMRPGTVVIDHSTAIPSSTSTAAASTRAGC